MSQKPKTKFKRFTYTKESGETSEREVWVIEQGVDHIFGIDLSQFEDEEREYYKGLLLEIEDIIKNEIAQAGLETCYRKFLTNRMS